MRRLMVILALASIVASWGRHSFAQTPADRATTEDIRSKLLRLPYYGVFDFQLLA